MAERLIVAIDGPSGVGKSTAARRLADRLGVPMLDTGAMYRAMALAVLEQGVDPASGAPAIALATEAKVHLRPIGESGFEVMLDGDPVGERIRTPVVAAATSELAVHPEVRRRMVAIQRAAAAEHGAVVEGRDIGTVVFPDTPHKFFLDARVAVRVERRRAQLAGTGIATDADAVAAALVQRDARDATRAESPLRCDERYCRIDTSDVDIETVVDRMTAAINRLRTPA